MALRVLLADESSTIKKVIQLALQDFGVEVKSVPVGLDVLSVAKSFKPDLIFADVLLSKKSGYDVSQELKSNPDTQKIPVILMWSGFMELDEARAKSSLADDRLEKPFDADVLRGLVRKHVPKVQTNTISSYLNFPPMPEFEEPARPGIPDSKPLEIEALPELDEEEFSQVPLHPQKDEIPNLEENWTQQSINKLKLPDEIIKQELTGIPATNDPGLDKYMIPDSELGEVRVESDGEFEEITFSAKGSLNEVPSSASVVKSSPLDTAPSTSSKPMSATETVLLERVAREEARALIESICWKILPEIAERVIREEIAKVMKQAEKDI